MQSIVGRNTAVGRCLRVLSPLICLPLGLSLAGAAHAQLQAPRPCSDQERKGAPRCDEGGRSRPVTLERLLSEDFEKSLTWDHTGDVVWYVGEPSNGRRAVRIGGGGTVTVAVPLVNRADAVVIFAMGMSGLDLPGEGARADYFTSSGWEPLVQVSGGPVEAGELPQFAFALPDLANVPAFKLRFAVTGSDRNGYAYIDDVSVWAPRVVPPPAARP